MPRQKESWNQWVENKAVYAVKRDILFSIGRIGPKTAFVEMDKWRSIDIDNPSDLELARAIYRDKHGMLDS
jgi:N-acylneuraminate cytidylyltransferase